MTTIKSSDSPVLSIIIPVYNRRKYLERTLVEVFAEPLASKQIIIVDDGSTDDIADFLMSLPVTHLRREHRGGPGVARNDGIARALGTYLFFLDSDDLLEPLGLSRLVNFLETHPECRAVGGQMAGVIDEQGERLATGLDGLGEDDVGDRLSIEQIRQGKKPVGGVWRYLWRSDFVRVLGGFDPALNESGEDWDFIIRAVKRCSIPFLPVPLIWRRCHPDNLTGAQWTSRGLIVSSRCVAQNQLVNLSHGLPLSFKS